METETITTRERIVRAAADLLTRGGREAVSTRAVSAAAGVQAPTLYRLFGDMSGLLDAVAAHGFATYLHDKHALAATDDPVADLRRGWDLHVSFGLTRPAFYILMYGEPRPGATSHAAAEAMAILRRTITRIAESGLLRVPVDRAATMLHSACMGVTFTLIGTEPRSRDPHLSEQTREAVIAAVTTTPQPSTPQPLRASVLTLRAALTTDQAPELSSLTPAERTLLAEWLDRLVH